MLLLEKQVVTKSGTRSSYTIVVLSVISRNVILLCVHFCRSWFVSMEVALPALRSSPRAGQGLMQTGAKTHFPFLSLGKSVFEWCGFQSLGKLQQKWQLHVAPVRMVLNLPASLGGLGIPPPISSVSPVEVQVSSST